MVRETGRGWRWTGLLVTALGGALLAGCHTAPARKPAPVIVAPSVCADFTVSIYFEPRSAAVTAEARSVIDLALRQSRGCRVTGVQVLGLADAPGDPDANLALSKARAASVAKVLAHRGLTTVEFQLAAAGDAGAQTRSGEARPLRRRADVQFHFMSPAAPAPHP